MPLWHHILYDGSQLPSWLSFLPWLSVLLLFVRPPSWVERPELRPICKEWSLVQVRVARLLRTTPFGCMIVAEDYRLFSHHIVDQSLAFPKPMEEPLSPSVVYQHMLKKKNVTLCSCKGEILQELNILLQSMHWRVNLDQKEIFS